MKIIKQGDKKRREQKFRGDCQKCGAEVEYDRHELAIQWDEREQGELAEVQCPCCNDRTTFWVYPRK